MAELKTDDYKKTLKLLLNLSNKDKEQYELRTYGVSESGSYETVHGDRKYGRFTGHVWVIGVKEALDEIGELTKLRDIPCTYMYRGKIIKLVNEGYSLVVMTDFVHDFWLLPNEYETKSNTIKISVSDVKTDMMCYTYSDELSEAVGILVTYIKTNGGNFKRTAFDKLVEKTSEIRKKKYTQKVMK